MKVLLSWIREFVDVPESAEEIGKLLSVRGLALEGLEPVPGNPKGLPPPPPAAPSGTNTNLASGRPASRIASASTTE